MGIQELTYLLQGLLWTLLLTAIGFVGGIVFGMVVALLRVSPSPWLRIPMICWIGVFQGTPLLMQLFVAYFGLPLLGFNLPAWGAVSIALTAHASAFLGEIWRGAIQAVPGGQTEAANALGLPGWSRMVDVVMPQAFKLSLPATVGFLVQLLKGTSLAAIWPAWRGPSPSWHMPIATGANRKRPASPHSAAECSTRGKRCSAACRMPAGSWPRSTRLAVPSHRAGWVIFSTRTFCSLDSTRLKVTFRGLSKACVGDITVWESLSISQVL